MIRDRDLVLEIANGQMDLITKEIWWIILDMETENIMKMGQLILDNGNKISNMEEESWLKKMVKS